MTKTKAPFLALTGTAALVLAGCWGGTPVSENTTPAPTPSATPTCSLSCQDVPQADHTGPSSLSMDSKVAEKALLAGKEVIEAYTAKSKPKAAWFADLAPLLTTAYAQDAQYIEPSRLPFGKAKGDPFMRDSSPYQVRVYFATDAGEWVAIMTRQSGSAPWLASNVLPSKDAR